MWGCTAGLLAGLVPGWVATVLHWPTRAGLWWVAGVARIGADAPLGHVGLGAIGLVAVLFVVAVLARRLRAGPWSFVGVSAMVAAVAVLLVVPHLSAGTVPSGRVEVGGAELWRGSGVGAATVLIVPGDARADAVLAGLRQRGVTRLDLVVLRSPGPTAAAILTVVRERVEVIDAWALPASPAADVRAPPPTPVEAGGLRVEVKRGPSGGRLDAVITPTASAGRAVGASG